MNHRHGRRSRLASTTMIVAITVAATGCAAGPHRFENGQGEGQIGDFTYRMPGPGWRAVQYPRTATGMLSHHYNRDGDRLAFQLTEFEPVRPVRDQSGIVAWAKQAGGPNAAPDGGRGAACARYAHRWDQTLSLGGPPKPWASIEERGLFCVSPTAQNRLLQVRVFERLAPGAPRSAEFDALAESLLAQVRAQ